MYKKPAFLLSVFVLTFSLFAFYLSLRLAQAQVPDPYVPCGDVDDPEFHSLRPYQSSPCNENLADIALSCGNALVIKDTVTGAKAPGINCSFVSSTVERCNFSVNRSRSMTIDVSESELPIAGNTELVVNSQDQPNPEEIDDATKVNEYLSWYLNGTINRAEYPFLSKNSEEDIYKLINLSGPISKLLPQRIQTNLRIETIKNAGGERHNQIVACTSVLGVPIPCYGQGFSNLIDSAKRLTDWEGSISGLPGTSYNKATPPLEEDFDTFREYWEAYREWRGETCGSFTVPLIGTEILLCFDNPLRPNFWSNLFPYIPFSSTEDRKGALEVDSADVSAGSGVTLTNVVVDSTAADLFFSHLEETDQLADILQTTYLPLGNQSTGPVPPGTKDSLCEPLEVRSNPGDDLFPGEIKVSLSYTANFSCDFDINSLNRTCSKDIFVNLGLVTETPVVDNVWSKLVQGPSAVFKRLFPKIGDNTPILALEDIPAATKVKFSGDVNQESDLYFPHLGGIYDYFLKCVQTALRPKGFGEICDPGQPDIDSQVSEEEVGCNQNAPEVNIPNLISKEDFVALADRGWGTPNLAEECFNDVVARANGKGVNPAYALLTWLIESGASNYTKSVEDFGIHLSDVRGFNDQIERFLGTVSGDFHNNCAENGIPPWSSKLFGHIACYVTGEFDQSRPDYQNLKDRVVDYYATFVNILWPTIAPGCPLSSGPTDNSCP